MEAVAACLDGRVLGEVEEKHFWQELPRLREQCGDRAVLRAIHYFEENARTLAQRDALVAGDFAAFARLVEKSGHTFFFGGPSKAAEDLQTYKNDMSALRADAKSQRG